MPPPTPDRRQSANHRKVVIGSCDLYLGDSEEILSRIGSVDSVVTDPPYGLRFMAKRWDYEVPHAETWKQCLTALKPGGHLLAFFGSRTYHRGVVQVEDAGFEIRDQIMWVYGSGFPKSLDVSKAIDKAAGAKREVIGRRTDRAATLKRDIRGGKYIGSSKNIDLSAITAPATDAAKHWEGWGTALKPAHEPIVLARKRLSGTVVENISSFGTGALNLALTRIPIAEDLHHYTPSKSGLGKNGIYGASSRVQGANSPTRYDNRGRWPANFIHDGSPEVLTLFPQANAGGNKTGTEASAGTKNLYGPYRGTSRASYADTGSAARFFYCAKARKSDRDEGLEHFTPRRYSHDGRKTPTETAYQRNNSVARNHHPTVKPTDLMRYLCRLVTPLGGVVLDPFMGSGSTGKAAVKEGFRFIGIEREPEYFEIACARIADAYRQANLPFGKAGD
jgi:DNA modification methylase